MSLESVLIVDDEPLMRAFLAEVLKRKGYRFELAENGKKALSLIKEGNFDLVITDMKLPDLTGLDILKKAKETIPGVIVIVMTAFGTIENAVEAMKLGAFHYLLKPFTPDSIEIALEKAKEHQKLVTENAFLRKEATGGASQVIAHSPQMKKILEDVKRIAKSNASVLVHGESGTGKEMIAALIHNHSLRAAKSYIKVNCAAIPDTLLESEFFGHEKGAFTGALNKRVGRFELADQGTLFLDEVTEIPLQLQPKLLRAIQELEFERVGGSKTVGVDVRLISSSNRDLKKAIDEKIFREDLYYRLNVIPLHLPPLRERSEDILPLADYFLEKFSRENKFKKKTLNASAKKKLLTYAWPGNIRELANVIERAVVLDPGLEIDPEHLFID
jgi:two-component system response regulator AtoC